MRALGAQKTFVRRMFVMETLGISGVFGLIGLGLGIITVLILNVVGLPAPNNFFEILFGGKILRPVVTLSAFIQGILMILGIGFISSLYPVAVALKILPIKAMQSN
jgi:ABC-type antimicrobial peptide transport system permease subunit